MGNNSRHPNYSNYSRIFGQFHHYEEFKEEIPSRPPSPTPRQQPQQSSWTSSSQPPPPRRWTRFNYKLQPESEKPSSSDSSSSDSSSDSEHSKWSFDKNNLRSRTYGLIDDEDEDGRRRKPHRKKSKWSGYHETEYFQQKLRKAQTDDQIDLECDPEIFGNVHNLEPEEYEAKCKAYYEYQAKKETEADVTNDPEVSPIGDHDDLLPEVYEERCRDFYGYEEKNQNQVVVGNAQLELQLEMTLEPALIKTSDEKSSGYNESFIMSLGPLQKSHVGEGDRKNSSDSSSFFKNRPETKAKLKLDDATSSDLSIKTIQDKKLVENGNVKKGIQDFPKSFCKKSKLMGWRNNLMSLAHARAFPPATIRSTNEQPSTSNNFQFILPPGNSQLHSATSKPIMERNSTQTQTIDDKMEVWTQTDGTTLLESSQIVIMPPSNLKIEPPSLSSTPQQQLNDDDMETIQAPPPLHNNDDMSQNSTQPDNDVQYNLDDLMQFDLSEEFTTYANKNPQAFSNPTSPGAAAVQAEFGGNEKSSNNLDTETETEDDDVDLYGLIDDITASSPSMPDLQPYSPHCNSGSAMVPWMESLIMPNSAHPHVNFVPEPVRRRRGRPRKIRMPQLQMETFSPRNDGSMMQPGPSQTPASSMTTVVPVTEPPPRRRRGRPRKTFSTSGAPAMEQQQHQSPSPANFNYLKFAFLESVRITRPKTLRKMTANHLLMRVSAVAKNIGFDMANLPEGWQDQILEEYNSSYETESESEDYLLPIPKKLA